MRLSRVVFSRDGKAVILQGMIHIAPEKLYALLQRDVDWAVQHGYQIFFEGTKTKPFKRTSTSNERMIRKFFLFLFDIVPMLAEAFGISLQGEKIVYPQDAVNADITFSECTQQLDRNGFRCDFIWQVITRLGKKEIKKRVGELFVKDGGFNALADNLDNAKRRFFRHPIAWIMFWLLFRKAEPVILDYRNEAAMAKIRAQSNGRNIFIHYGEGHIKGLVCLLKKDGWVVKETAYTDLAEFC